MENKKDFEVSIIIPCKNEGINIKQTIDFLFETEAKYISNIIIVDDDSNDNCCEFLKKDYYRRNNVILLQTKSIGAARARNLGASFAESAKILIFCDAHITMKQGWLFSILKAFEDMEVSVVCPGIGHFTPNSPVGYGQTWNEKFETYWLKRPKDIKEIPLAPGGCLAIRKSVFDDVGGFDGGFSTWGYEDVELSVKLWLLGYKIFVHPGVRIGHKFRKKQPYNVDITEFHYNKLRMAFSHFNSHRICKLLKSMREYPNYYNILDKIISSDINMQRSDYFNRRIHDDEWFFRKFNIPF